MKIYVASPLGFTVAGRRYNDQVVLPAVRAAGFEPLDPWEGQEEPGPRVFAANDAEREAMRDRNHEIGGSNARMIKASAGLLAILDGYDVDSGTAAEIGYAAALGLPIVGLRSDTRISGDNEATLVNLQVEWFIRDSGGRLTTSLEDAIAALRSTHGLTPSG